MRARVSARVARLVPVQSQGTAQVSLAEPDEVDGAALLRWAIPSGFSFESTRSTRRQPVPPHKGHCDSAMPREHRLGASQGASTCGRGKKGNVKNENERHRNVREATCVPGSLAEVEHAPGRLARACAGPSANPAKAHAERIPRKPSFAAASHRSSRACSI